MECQSSDSKKLLKVFDASKRKHTRKKREGFDDTNSLATDDSTTGCQGICRRVVSAKTSLQNLSNIVTEVKPEVNSSKRDRDSSPSVSPADRRRSATRSPRRHHRLTRDGLSLALKAGLISTPRSTSPRQDGDIAESVPQDQDSFIYAFLEDAVKRDKRKHRHSRRHDERRGSRDRDASEPRERHRHRRRREEQPSRDRTKDRYKKKEVRALEIDQTALLETFAKLCSQFNEKSAPHADANQLARAQSHKSLQCEVVPRRDSYNVDRRPERLQSRQMSSDNISPSRIRSHDNFRSRENNIASDIRPSDRKSQCVCYAPYEKETKYASKLNVVSSRMRNTDRYHDYPRDNTPTRSRVDGYYKPHYPEGRDYRDYDDCREPTRDRPYEDKRRYCEQKTSRSFDVRREGYDGRARRTGRSDYNGDKFYPESRDVRDKRYVDSPKDKYYDDKPSRDRNFNVSTKERLRRNLERFERNSIASRDDDYRDRYSERERDSGLSVADGETSTMSGRSNCLRVVKQEISEQREAMDKMMKLWKDLMRCFKGISQTQGQDRGIQESAANVRESAAAQLRLWRECMRRYETVARDVGDTDARLMEEINKQRSEMSEMATMWQECLQRYRDMSNDFNSLKQQLSSSESPSRLPAAPLLCAEGEGVPPAAPYRMPAYPQMPPPLAHAYGGSPLRPRASAPPAWGWPPPPARTQRRRSSPDSGSRGSRERRHRQRRSRERERRDDSRYKEKSKPNGARSEHRHRKR
ncbi:uncharacterized protein [Epargyreus clarus]|uniref:uncharacterized protein n=1 Tax=Epargyreus clarus TaxID=520877 RepID=UPI003C2E9D5B